MAEMDDNQVYIVESGRLISLASRYTRSSCAPPPSSPQSLHVASQGLLPRPKSKLLTLAYSASSVIIRHFHAVESLYGLPEHIGRILFDVGMKMDLFMPYSNPDGEVKELPSEVRHALIIFAEAFPSIFLTRLDLSGVDCSSLLSDVLTSLSASVSELLLDGCKLDSAEPKTLSAISSMPQLRRVSIRNNDLWDERIRCFTAGWRYRRPMKMAIREIDVRGNKYLSNRCVLFFLEIQTLDKVIFSSTLELEEKFPLKECCSRGWKLKRTTEQYSIPSGSCGWFADVHHEWIRRRYLPSFLKESVFPELHLILWRNFIHDSLENSSTRRELRTKNPNILNDSGDRDILSSYDV